MLGDSKLYYECHVTIEPVFDEKLEVARAIAVNHKFSVADLLMQKRKADTQERSKDDTFMTGRHKNYETLHGRMVDLIRTLQRCGYTVWRYKIEDTIIDSKMGDEIGILS